MKYWLVIFAVCLSFSSVQGQKAARQDTSLFITLGTRPFLDSLRACPGIQLLDVRTKKEYAAGCIPGAVNLDVRKKNFRRKARRRLDKSRVVAVYCKGGVRSRQAARQLAEAGFTVYNLDKGYDAYLKEKE